MQKFLLFFLCSSLLTPAAFAAGVLVEATGPVTIKIADKETPASIGLELPDGSKVEAKKGGKAQVMLMDGAILAIPSGTKVEIGNPKKENKGQKTVIQGIALALNEASSSGSGPTVHGMVKMGPPGTGVGQGPVVLTGLGVEGLYPVNTTIPAEETIVFRWSEATTIDWKNPVLMVNDVATSKALKVQPIVVNATSITFFAKELGLVPGGKYNWHLGQKQGRNVAVKGALFPFRLLSEAEKAKLEADIAVVESLGLSSPEAKGFLIGQLYYKFGLYHQMVEALKPIYDVSKHASIKRLLFVAHMRMGLAETEKYR